jgi:hypothetical protein
MVMADNENGADGADGADGTELKFCSFCELKCSKQTEVNQHNSTHNFQEIPAFCKKGATGTKQFVCLDCDFECFKQSNYERHLATIKHKKSMKDAKKLQDQQAAMTTNTCANCNKQFSYPSGLCRHKKMCITPNPINHNNKQNNHSICECDDNHSDCDIYPDEIISTKNQNVVIGNNELLKMMMTMMTTNSQLQSQMLEMMKAAQMTTATNATTTGVMPNINGDSNTTNVNSNNNTFNMNMFLNEKCKDAMNMKDFVNSIQLNMTDLENVGRLGYVEGMSNIFIDNLQKTDIYKRPVHCSDIKRETLYVKDNDQWEREEPNHPKMMNAVLAVEQKNVALVNEWAKANPKCMNSNTRENETYFRLSKIVTDGEKDGNIDKVIRKVAKKVGIEKGRGGLSIEDE